MSLSFNSRLSFQDFQRGYAIAIFSIWGLGIEIPRLLIRYGKAYPLVINIHSILMIMVGLFTIMYVIAEISMFQIAYGNNYDGLSGLPYAQFILSIILSCFVLIQFILGFLVRVEMFKNTLSSDLFAIKTAHKLLGYGVWIFGKIVATLVVSIYTNELVLKAWLFCLGGLAILFIIFQVIYRSESRSIIFTSIFRHKNKYQKYHNQIYNKLLDKKQNFQCYKSKGIRYVIIDNSMYYVDQNFMHPGGEYIFSLLNGRQINYYLKGAKSISPGHPRHIHTKYVIKYLENRMVGDLSVEPLLQNKKIANENVDWKIVQSVKTNYPGTHMITFQNQQGLIQQHFKIYNFGKYIMMGCSTEEVLNKTQRPYYFCFSISIYQRSLLDRFRNYYKYYYFGENIDEAQDKGSIQSSSQTLTLFIKEYRRGLLTRFLLNAPKDRIFSINGPYGRGLNLNQRSSGYYMFIAAGIGIVAFVDLFTYLLQKTLLELIKIKASSPSLKKINAENITYEHLSNLKILLVGTFTSSEKFYLNTTIKQLYYLNKKHGLKQFNMILHYQNTQIQPEIKMIKENFTKEFFISLMQQEQPDKVFYSGSDKLQQILRRAQPQLKLKQQIYYM